MKRIPTISMNVSGFSLSKCVPEKLGDILTFDVNKDTKQIYISNKKGGQMVMVKYPSTIPIVKSVPLLKWIKAELGDLDYSKMPVEWDGEKFIATPGVKE